MKLAVILSIFVLSLVLESLVEAGSYGAPKYYSKPKTNTYGYRRYGQHSRSVFLFCSALVYLAVRVHIS